MRQVEVYLYNGTFKWKILFETKKIITVLNMFEAKPGLFTIKIGLKC